MITEHGLAVTFCPAENEEVLPNDNTILPNENYTFSTIKQEATDLKVSAELPSRYITKKTRDS